MSGWIKLHRKFEDWEWYTDSKSVHLFIHMLLRANHEPRRWRGNQIETGQFITSLESLKTETGISVQSIRTILGRLRDTKEITCQPTRRYTMITICNWASYQTREMEINTVTNNQVTNNQHAANTLLTTNKNDKKVKNEKKQTKRAQHEAAVFASALPEKYSILFCEAWQEFCDHRADMSAWLTERAIKQLLKILDPMSEQQAIDALNKSIANGWKGVFPEKVPKSKDQQELEAYIKETRSYGL